MMDTRVERTGIIAGILLAPCCLTPVLVALGGAAGFAAIGRQLGLTALPVIALLTLVALYAIWRRRGRVSDDPHR